ncbi:MAG: response regulator [Pseudomonadota bacterium]
MPPSATESSIQSNLPSQTQQPSRTTFGAFLKRAYWPTQSLGRTAGATLGDTATHRGLSIFCVSAGFLGSVLTLLFYDKNILENPAQGSVQLVISFALILMPIATEKWFKPIRVAQVVLVGCFVALTILALRLDGLISIKAMLYVPIVMSTTLLFGVRFGVWMAAASVIALCGLYVVRDQIGGNADTTMTIGELSFLFLIGLNASVVLTAFGAGVFVAETRKLVARLRDARSEAQAADAAKARFLASVSHELRAPLAGMLHIAMMLESNATSPERRQLIRSMQSSGEALLAVIDEILDVSTLQSRGVGLVNKPFSLRSVAETIVHLQCGAARNKSLVLRLRSDPTLPGTLLGDPMRIAQVLTNLVSNAIKFTDYGVVSIELSHVIDGEHAIVQMAVIDTGAGIEEAEQVRIFEPFVQTNGARHEGVGLGLAIANGVVAKMGGSIDLISEPGYGSEFRVTVPLLIAMEEQQPIEPVPARIWLAASPPAGESETVKWSDFAASVVSVPNPDSLLDRLRSANELPDIIVLMESHGERYATRLAEAIRACPYGERIPLLIVGDEMTSAELIRCQSLRACRHLLLPVQRRELLDTLEMLLELSLPNSVALVSDVDSEAETSADRVSAPTERNSRLLVAEDNPVNRSFLKRFLPEDRFAVTYVTNGAEAVDAWAAQDFDLVLMDIAMPVMDGVAATEEIRRREAADSRRRTPIVALTAYAMAADAERFRVAGIDDQLAKPYRLPALMTCIDTWLVGQQPALADNPSDALSPGRAHPR